MLPWLCFDPSTTHLTQAPRRQHGRPARPHPRDSMLPPMGREDSDEAADGTGGNAAHSESVATAALVCAGEMVDCKGGVPPHEAYVRKPYRTHAPQVKSRQKDGQTQRQGDGYMDRWIVGSMDR